MKYRRLGQAGIQLSEIGLGSWLTYGFGVGDETAAACLRTAFDLGVNFFDTADVYARGSAEEAFGRELSKLRRRDLVIATKCYFPMSEGINDRGLSRKHIFESVHDSLRRMKVDYIDLYQCHRHDPHVSYQELVRAMDDLVRQGKILYWGVSEWSAAQIADVCAVADRLGACRPVSNQPEYSMAARRVETNGVQEACDRCGMGMVVWSPLKQGLLSGKYARGAPAQSRASDAKMNAFLREISTEIVARTEKLRPIAEGHGATLAQVAIRWLLGRRAVTSVIIGATRAEQVRENVAAAAVELTEADLAQIDAVFPASEFQ